MVRSELLLKIQEISLNDSQEFPVCITQLLVDFLELKACSFYTISGDRKHLILRGQTGFSYEHYESYELPLNTVAGEAYDGGRVVVKEKLFESEKYRDKLLVEKYKLECMIALPLYVKGVDVHKDRVSGAICLYPKKCDGLCYLSEKDAKVLIGCISYSYGHSIERSKTLAREKVVSAISVSGDLNSALHRALNSLKEQVNVDAASIYLYDERLKLLRLAASTGMENTLELNKHDMVYGKKDKSCDTWQVFKQMKPLIVSDLNENAPNDKYIEQTKFAKKSLMILPVNSLMKNVSNRRTKGVLRMLNKQLKHQNKYELISFTDEDKDILNYVCEIIGLTVHMFMNREMRISYFEKIMHGTKSNIQASVQNLDFLERNFNFKLLDKKLHFSIYDTREWLEDIKIQMDRLDVSVGSGFHEENISLAADVLINAVRLFERSAKTREIAYYDITNLQNEGFFNLPPVRGDIKALMTVFRNLIENALKYRRYDENRCVVKLSYEVERRYICIYFSDWGIGIPLEDEHDVFQEGFRSENALRQDPAGTGLGLSQSRQIMLAMGGELSLINTNPVTMRIKIKRVEI